MLLILDADKETLNVLSKHELSVMAFDVELVSDVVAAVSMRGVKNNNNKINDFLINN